MFFELPVSVYAQLINTNNFVLLETSKHDKNNIRSYLFINPVDEIKIYAAHEVPYLFSKIDESLKQNYYLAGYLGYECGYHFEEVFSNLNVHLDYPVAWFGVYERPIVFNHLTGKYENCAFACDFEKEGVFDESKLENFIFNIPEAEYFQKIEKIKDYIAKGDVYQINFTGKYTFTFYGSALA